MATELESGDHEPHRRHSHQEPEADYAKWRHEVIVVYVDVQREVWRQQKPDGQSKRHEHRYANEMFHRRPHAAGHFSLIAQ